MKVTKIFMLMMASMAVISCSKDTNQEPQPPINPDGDAYASFSIALPGSRSATRAESDGIPAEQVVKTMHVFIYDAEAPFSATVASYSVAAGTLETDGNKWVAKNAVKTKKTNKKVYVGLNLPTAIVNEITGKGYAAFHDNAFAQTVAQVASLTDGFVMFSTESAAAVNASQLQDSEDAANSSRITFNVERVVAKASVSKGAAFEVNGGGTISDMKYGWRNINNKFYFVQKIDGGLIKDYNWDSFQQADFTPGNDALNVLESGIDPTVFSYTMENAFKYTAGGSKVAEASYLTVSGTFKPDQVIHFVPGKDENTAAAISDFEYITNSDPVGTTFYLVRAENGKVDYFNDASIAEKFAELAIAGAAGMPPMSGNYVLADNTFTNGACYYHVFVNAEATAPEAPYNVYRNQYFKVTINSIQGPGNPTDDFDSGEDLKGNAWISADVVIKPWTVIEEGHDL